MKWTVFFITSIISAALGIVSVIFGVNTWVVLTIILCIFIMLYCTKNLDQHIVLLLFLGCYFVFLIGGIIVKEYFGYDMSYQFSEENYNYMTFTIFLSLLFVLVGYLTALKVRIGFGNSKKIETEYVIAPTVDETKLKVVRQISLISMYLFLIPYVMVLIEGVLVVRNFGYYEFYSYESSLPYVITESSELYIVALFLFLSTLPSKKEAKIPLIIFFIGNCLSLLTGRRIYFVVDNLIIGCYLFFRNKLSPEDKWIQKKHVRAFVLLIPVLVIFLYSYNYTRFGSKSTAESPIDAFLLFFRQQGFSANLIPLGKMYEDSLSNDVYSIYDILRSIRLNPIIRLLTNSSYRDLYNGTREALAISSGSFARAISYAVVRTRYIGGYGMGSCYIAELYHDLSYFGICLGNFIYGYFMARINKLSINGTVKNALILLAIRGLFKAPRYCFDSPFYFILSINMWIYIGMVYALANLICKRNK